MTSIKHLEDLDNNKFIQVLDNIEHYDITEKVDGVNLVFGLDYNGVFYTSRESKNGKRFYSISDFDEHPSSNAILAAHIVLSQKSIQIILDYGDQIEIEVLLGKQPNAIEYGKNRIIFIRSLVSGGEKRLDRLLKYFDNVYSIEHIIYNSSNGIDLNKQAVKTQWIINDIPQIKNTIKYINNDLTKFKKFLLKNDKSLNINLNTIKKEKRELAKTNRNSHRKSASKFKLDIKNIILKEFVNNIIPKFRDSNDIQFGIEGIVLKHKITKDQIKIVDKTRFSKINEFNHVIRTIIKNPSNKKINSELIGLKVETDLYNHMLSEIAILLNEPELGHLMSIKRHIKKYTSIEEFITIQINKFLNHHSLKKQIIEIIKDTINYLYDFRILYLKHYKGFKYVLDDNIVLIYNDIIHERTLTNFAVVNIELNTLLTTINKTISIEDIITILYEKQLNGL